MKPFLSLRAHSSNPTDETIAGLPDFVLDIYFKRRPLTVNTIPKLRWHLFSKKQKSAETIPPTEGVLYYKIMRCRFVTFILHSAMHSCINRPDPARFGWNRSGNTLVPITTDDLPAPLDMIELTICGCKSNCLTSRCKCKKFGLVGTDVCHPEKCENTPVDHSNNSDYDATDDEDSDEYDKFRLKNNVCSSC